MHSTVYIVDDDSGVRKSLGRSLRYHDYDVVTFESGDAFIEGINDDSYGCIILDLAMPGMSGLEVQSKLLELGCQMPIIFMTGHGDVPTSVRALKDGAVDFLEKPFPINYLLERVAHALENEKDRAERALVSSITHLRFALLTDREIDVMTGLTAGFANASNKQVAIDLGISYRTVEIYRARIMEKMEASSLTHLVELAKICGVYRN